MGKEYPRAGEGIEAYVDGSDTGYNAQGRPVEEIMASNGFAKTNGSVKNGTNATVQQTRSLWAGVSIHMCQSLSLWRMGLNSFIVYVVVLYGCEKPGTLACCSRTIHLMTQVSK